MPTPSFDSLAAFFAMGGHGFYVWLSLALALVAVLGNVVALRNARRSFLLRARGRAQHREDTGLAAPVDAAATLLDQEASA